MNKTLVFLLSAVLSCTLICSPLLAAEVEDPFAAIPGMTEYKGIPLQIVIGMTAEELSSAQDVLDAHEQRRQNLKLDINGTTQAMAGQAEFGETTVHLAAAVEQFSQEMVTLTKKIELARTRVKEAERKHAAAVAALARTANMQSLAKPLAQHRGDPI